VQREQFALSYTERAGTAGLLAMTRLRRRPLLGICLLALLAACAAPQPQALVHVFAPVAPLPAGTTYRHDRLPSHVARPDLAALEGVADAHLSRAGLRRADANARLAVQVTVSQDAGGYAPAWGPGAVGLGVGGGSWGRGGGVGVGLSFPIGGGTTAYPSQRVDVLLRDLASGQVVFQSQSSSNSGATPAMLLEAALRDFPNAPPGTRVMPLPPLVY
jgi:hypothetical protein